MRNERRPSALALQSDVRKESGSAVHVDGWRPRKVDSFKRDVFVAFTNDARLTRHRSNNIGKRERRCNAVQGYDGACAVELCCIDAVNGA